MRRTTKFSAMVFSLMIALTGCLTLSSPGGSSGLSAINALSYTEDLLNVQLARGIWDRVIDIEYVEASYSYYDPSQPDTFFISSAYSTADTVQHVAEYATVLAYLGYLRAHQGDATVEEDAEAHARKTIELAVEKYVVGAGQTYDDARGFRARLMAGNATDRAETLFTIE